MVNQISCLIVDPDQEAIRLIDILCRKVGTVELRWKAGSMTSAFEIIRKHMPEMAIVGLDSDTGPAIESISAMARDFPSLYLLALLGKKRLRPHPEGDAGGSARLPRASRSRRPTCARRSTRSQTQGRPGRSTRRAGERSSRSSATRAGTGPRRSP